MIFITGFGQMCNNILQFGHFYAWGRENGVKTIAMRFCYKYPFFQISKRKGYNFFTYLFAKYGAKMKLFPVVSFDDEQSVTIEKLKILRQSKYVLAEGWYMRDFDLFLKYKDEIRELFSFSSVVKKKVATYFSNLPQAGLTLGVHIRRGDYIRWLNGRYFFSDEEYIAIIQSFLNIHKGKNVRILISTNDKAINIELYQQCFGINVHFLNGNAGEDLCSLSHCDCLIGPPSTFSLVAAFYRDLRLYWISDKNKVITPDCFEKFDYLFRNII